MGEIIDKQAEIVVKLLSENRKKVSSAESCTGGLVSAAITSVGGSSEVFDMGMCSYANAVKQEKLNVPKEYLESFGAVSEQVAKAMAEGIAEASGSDFSVSTTGIAGPSGGTPDKPVGTVWIGVYSRPNGARAEKFVFDTEKCPTGISEREFIRRQAVFTALKILETEIRTALENS